ncbi:MAG: C40 family peptidase [Armatimonadetes bacterium]|nr:C40 family peptidase [Armatimonadota bacterium]
MAVPANRGGWRAVWLATVCAAFLSLLSAPVWAAPPRENLTLILEGEGKRAAAATSRQAAAKPQRVARLGVVRRDNTRIYRRADSRSRVLYRCARETALGLVGQTSKYYAVKMVDGSLGFIDKSLVELGDYTVSLDANAARYSNRIIQIAVEYIGVPYEWGGNTRAGIDCSGFVKSVFKRLGVELPRVARDQFNVGQPVRWGELAPGDRLYFCSKGSAVDHTGIYIGGGRFIHASGSHNAVVISSVNEPKYFRTLVGGRRS